MPRNPLTPKVLRFIDEYLVDLNGAHAAERAGYSRKTSKEIAYQLLGKPHVMEAIAAAKAARAERTEITTDRVLQELAAMAFFDPGELGTYEVQSPADIAALPEALRRSIVGWSWDRVGNFTLKLADKPAVVALTMRHLGMLQDKVDHTTKGDKLPANTEPAVLNVTIGK